MCSGGRLLADFVAGTYERPAVAELADNLTMTADGTWVVWAYKLARDGGDRFVPLTGRGSYPADAVAECLCPPGPGRRWQVNRERDGHTVPDPACTCGFHALSTRTAGVLAAGPGVVGLVSLIVALSGRVLAFEAGGGKLLFRAGRQTVVRVERPHGRPEAWRRGPDDPAGFLARRPADLPSGAGPARLALPSRPIRVAVQDDAGWCRGTDEPTGAPHPHELVEA
jgi:hypothetical protein